LIDVWIRRMGSGKVHAARLPETAMYAATSWGAPCTGVITPIVSRCGSVLRGQAIVIPDDKLESWQRNKSTCKACEIIRESDPIHDLVA